MQFVIGTWMCCNDDSHPIGALELLEKAIHRGVILVGCRRWCYSRVIVIGVKGHVLVQENGVPLGQFGLLVPIAQVDVIVERMSPDSFCRSLHPELFQARRASQHHEVSGRLPMNYLYPPPGKFS